MGMIINASRSVHGTGANFTEKEMELVQQEYLAGMRLGGVDMFKSMDGILKRAKKNLSMKGQDMSKAYADYLHYTPQRRPRGVSREEVEAPPVR
jgi:hypothetical protein